MTRERFSGRCIPNSQVLLIAVGVLLVGAATAQAAGAPSLAAAYGSNGVNASIRTVQPAVSGLFQVHAPRAWVDTLDESGQPGKNGVPDFLDSWDAFSARTSSAILKSGYAFTTVDGLGHEVLYAGVQRASSGGPSSVVLEFNQKAGERLLGDLRISAEIDAAGGVGMVRFESFAGEAKGNAKFLPVAMLSGEGCNGAGSACVVANGALLEIGYNLTALGKPEKDFSGIQIRTPEDQASGTIRILSALAGATPQCVKEASGVNPVCTANDVRLAGVKDVVILPGDVCDLSNPNDTITVQSFTGIFTSGPQRYDIGTYIATDGGGADGARTGSCIRFGFNNNTPGLKQIDSDSCADIEANKTVEIPLGPVTIKCSDAFHVGADGLPAAGGDNNIDFFHCETWAQQANEINCQSSTDVKAGTPSKCGCSLIGAESGFCVAGDDNNPCTDDVCQGTCQTATGGGSQATCTSNVGCNAGAGETCRGIAPTHINNNNSCDDGNACTTDSCQAGVCTGTNSVTCPAPDQCHDAGTCSPATGLCSNPAKANGFACNDGSACTTDSCQSGVCTGTNSVTCTALDQCHDAGTCSPATGICSNPAKTDGSACSDGNACTSDSCQAGVCTGTNPVTCPAPDQCHNAGTCNTATGLCSNPAKADGTTCENAEASGGDCDAQDKCESGLCVEKYAGGSTVCRPVAGVCDKDEKCSGSSAACPDNEFLGNETVCRARTNPCDAAEVCSGASAGCGDDVCQNGGAPSGNFICTPGGSS